MFSKTQRTLNGYFKIDKIVVVCFKMKIFFFPYVAVIFHRMCSRIDSYCMLIILSHKKKRKPQIWTQEFGT